MESIRILVIDDEPAICNGCRLTLADRDFVVDTCQYGTKGLEMLLGGEYDLALLDMKLPDMNGMEILRNVKNKNPGMYIIFMTGYSSVKNAVDAMKLGAFEYLPKPFTDDQFKQAVVGALKVKKELQAEKPAVDFETEEGQLIQKREVIRVLDRTAEDPDFWLDLMEKGSAALADYQLSGRAKYAISQGDLNWINENVGELTQKQLMFIYKRLEREAW